MTTLFACGPAAIGHDTCAECDQPLGQHPAELEGLRYCSDDCVAYHRVNRAAEAAAAHMRVRDLMCECDTCTAAGRPTDAERHEWAEYLRDYGGAR